LGGLGSNQGPGPGKKRGENGQTPRLSKKSKVRGASGPQKKYKKKGPPKKKLRIKNPKAAGEVSPITRNPHLWKVAHSWGTIPGVCHSNEKKKKPAEKKRQGIVV